MKSRHSYGTLKNFQSAYEVLILLISIYVWSLDNFTGLWKNFHMRMKSWHWQYFNVRLKSRQFYGTLKNISIVCVWSLDAFKQHWNYFNVRLKSRQFYGTRKIFQCAYEVSTLLRDFEKDFSLVVSFKSDYLLIEVKYVQ